MGLSSFKFSWWAPKMHAKWPSKVIQGHWFGTSQKRIRNYTYSSSIITLVQSSPFQRYCRFSLRRVTPPPILASACLCVSVYVCLCVCVCVRVREQLCTCASVQCRTSSVWSSLTMRRRIWLVYRRLSHASGSLSSCRPRLRPSQLLTLLSGSCSCRKFCYKMEHLCKV